MGIQAPEAAIGRWCNDTCRTIVSGRWRELIVAGRWVRYNSSVERCKVPRATNKGRKGGRGVAYLGKGDGGSKAYLQLQIEDESLMSLMWSGRSTGAIRAFSVGVGVLFACRLTIQAGETTTCKNEGAHLPSYSLGRRYLPYCCSLRLPLASTVHSTGHRRKERAEKEQAPLPSASREGGPRRRPTSLLFALRTSIPVRMWNSFVSRWVSMFLPIDNGTLPRLSSRLRHRLQLRGSTAEIPIPPDPTVYHVSSLSPVGIGSAVICHSPANRLHLGASPPFQPPP